MIEDKLHEMMKELYLKGSRICNDPHTLQMDCLAVEFFRAVPWELDVKFRCGRCINWKDITDDMWVCLCKHDKDFLTMRIMYV